MSWRGGGGDHGLAAAVGCRYARHARLGRGCGWAHVLWNEVRTPDVDGRVTWVARGALEEEGGGRAELVNSREQHGASSGHWLEREQVVAAKTVDAPRRSVAPMGKRRDREETILLMMLSWVVGGNSRCELYRWVGIQVLAASLTVWKALSNGL